ncbi:PD-(D/E)XK nuclease family protein [Pedobacter changchengzhani]|uniref:PD-(D/E)XK nuclease family protein n=1 Tax=Pedobacter changchengzhani TaxID=2529274 RepID=A0A4R5MMX1_9SPHI|nr:PD-(D/E)XK nuclease family protein [Pedobacter changchengzhani]TDG37121.1 PD-(D/E)XK nuclease family protein [Pedobacter changchengzhani]
MNPFLKEVAEDLVAKFEQNLQDCAIVFNNKRPAAYLQKHLADIYQKPFWSPEIFTIQEFFAKATHLKIADHYTQFFTLYDCYIDLLKKEGVEKLPSIAKFHNIARIILGDFSQIDNDLVDADQLFTELEDIAVINQQFDFLTPEQKEFLSQFWQSYSEGKYKKQQELFIKMWKRMPVLYHSFHEKLKKEGFTTLSRLYKNIADGKNDVDFTSKYGGNKLAFVGFNALSKAEAKAFKRWQDEGKAIFYFDTDSYYLEDEMQEAGLFLRRNLKMGLVNQSKNEQSNFKSEKRDVNVYKVQGQTAQAKIVNELLSAEKELIENGKTVASTAIILADESLLIPTMQTIPSSVGNKKIDVNITMGFGLINSSLYGLADLWLTVQSEVNAKKTIQYSKAEAFLSHPLTGMSDKMRPKILDALIKEQLVEIPYQRLSRQGGLFTSFFEPINSSADAVKTLIIVLDYVLQRELASKKLKKIDAELFGRTLQELNRLQDTLQHHIEKYNADIELSFVLSIIQKSLSTVAVPLEGDPLNGIQIMGLLESRNLNFDRVIILGLNEGVVPQASTATTFIPDSLRRAYGMPVLENQDAISAYMFYRLIQRAKNVDFVYNSLTDESNSGEPSRFIKQLEYESGFNFHHKELQLAIKTELKREEVVVKSPKVQAVLNRYLTGQKYLSASALTTYISNPIDFFYKYIAGIEEPKEVEETVEAYKVGLILHDVMEQFYAQLKATNAEITSDRIKEKRTDIPKLIMQGFAQVLYDNRNATVHLNGMQKVIYAIVLEYVNIILKQDIDDAPFTLIGLEQKGSIGFNFEANGSPQQIKLFGIIDRVDLKNGIYRIVDYKSGGDKLKYSTIEECFDTDCNNINKALIQTLFYTHVYEQISKNEQVEPNLYIVKTMSKDGINFNGKGGLLKGDFLANEKQIFLNALRNKLKELFDYDIPFRASQVPGNYVYSIYTTLFGR